MFIWVVVALAGLAVLVAAVPVVGWPLMMGLSAGCILGGGLAIYRRISDRT
jgi:hypothetical protein